MRDKTWRCTQYQRRRRKEMGRKKGKKNELDCAQWTAAERIQTLVVVVDDNEQVGFPPLVEEASFRAGSRVTCHGSLRLSLVADLGGTAHPCWFKCAQKGTGWLLYVEHIYAEL